MPKLLLAVESETFRRVLELTFAGGDFDVVAVDDGEQAIARIPDERPDVVLADIALPLRSGYDVAAVVKNDAALSHIRVLLLAGAFEPVDDARAAAVKADGVLAKPFEPRHLLTRVQELLGLHPAAMVSPTIPRAAERLIPPRPLEFPRRGEMPPVPSPPVESADPPAAGLAIDRELDEYFEQLDAAFDGLGADPMMSTRPGDPLPSLDEDDRPVPTMDRLIGGDDAAGGNGPVAWADAPGGTFDLLSAGEPPASPRVHPPAVDSAQTGTIADAFAALLAFEEGDRSAPPVRLVPQAAPPVGEAELEEITRRVLVRLAPNTVKNLVADVVSEVAERLVRQEIERIRKNA